MGRNVRRRSDDFITLPQNTWALFGTGVRQVTITGNNVSSITADAFVGCTSLTSATIANSVASIGSYAFSGCINLNSVTMGNVTTVGRNMFAGCTALASTVVDNILSRIPFVSEEMFLGCTGLTSVVIPSNVTSIGGRAFINCTNLRTVTVANGINALTIGGNNTLQTGTNNPSFPNGVETVYTGRNVVRQRSADTWALFGTGVRHVTFTNNIANIIIATNAFNGCLALSSVTLPSTSPPWIDSNVFNNVHLPSTRLIVPQGAAAAFSADGVWQEFCISGVCEPPVFPATPGSCGAGLTWSYDVVTTTLTISGNGNMFDYTATNYPWYNFRSKIRYVVVNDGVIHIGNNAFSGCSGLLELYNYNASPQTITAQVFNGVHNNATLYVPVGSESVYQGTAVWTGFGNIQPITLRLPAITTSAATTAPISATLGGNVTNAGNPVYTERGVVYATTQNPTTSNTKVIVEGGGLGFYSTIVTGLSANTTYYARAYAINSASTVYGAQVSFTTPNIVPPVVTTSAATNIISTSATLGGNVTNSGNPAYTERGVVYATTQNPTTANIKVIVTGSGTGAYTTNVTRLSANTTYFARAYAINSAGTVYGAQISFTTLIPTVTIASQNGTINMGTAGTATFAVTTANIANGQPGTIRWFSNAAGTSFATEPSGISASVSNVSNNAATVTVNATTAAVQGIRYFRVTIDGVQSAVATLTVSFIPVTNITGVPATARVGVPLTLTGSVTPSNATNQNIIWSVQNRGTTGATISGNVLNITAAGAVTVRATIINGLTVSTNFTRDFNIVVDRLTSAPELALTNPLRAWMRGGLLHVTGLTIGEAWSVYSANGALIYSSVANDEEADITLLVMGVYIIRSGNNTVRVAFE